MQSPFFVFCIPPLIAMVQFLLAAKLFSLGFPNLEPDNSIKGGWLIVSLFVCITPTLLGAFWGARQILYQKQKIIAALGMLFNVLYFIGFLVFYLGIFITNATN